DGRARRGAARRADPRVQRAVRAARRAADRHGRGLERQRADVQRGRAPGRGRRLRRARVADRRVRADQGVEPPRAGLPVRGDREHGRARRARPAAVRQARPRVRAVPEALAVVRRLGAAGRLPPPCGAAADDRARGVPREPVGAGLQGARRRGRRVAAAGRRARRDRVLSRAAAPGGRGGGLRAMSASYPKLRNDLPPPDELVLKHAELVKRIAYHVASRLPPHIELEDLIQAGMIGLLNAAQNYSADKGANFETYAGIRIRGAMLDEARRANWTPRSTFRHAKQVAEAMRSIEAR